MHPVTILDFIEVVSASKTEVPKKELKEKRSKDQMDKKKKIDPEYYKVPNTKY